MNPICFVEVGNIYDLARLACAFERIPMPLYHLTFDNILAIQSEPINERIVYYYTKYDKEDEFLAYKISGCKEDIKLTNSITEPSYIYAPIISINELPDELIRKDEVNNKCKKILLKELKSLAKLCSYKSMLDESPTTLLYFGGYLGTFLSLDDDTFFYCIRGEPTANFLKYNMTTLQLSFTNRIEEHGYVYTKVIRLKNNHPLVEL